MTSKLRRTIVGVGIALGGAAPGCFGRSHFDAGDAGAGAAGDSNRRAGRVRRFRTTAHVAATRVRRRRRRARRVAMTARSTRPQTAPSIRTATCRGRRRRETRRRARVPCVDPLHECTDAYPPWRLLPDARTGNVSRETDYDGPLYCVDGRVAMSPRQRRRAALHVLGVVRTAEVAPDASADDRTGADGGDAAN